MLYNWGLRNEMHALILQVKFGIKQVKLEILSTKDKLFMSPVVPAYAYASPVI